MPYTTVAASSRSSTLRLRAFSGHRPCNTSRRVVLGSCVAAGACFGRVALGRPGSGTAIQRGADVGGVVVAVAAILWGGASDSVHRQSGLCTRWRASLCCSQRQVPRVLFFQQGSGCCSTLTRSSMSWERGCSMEACERISHIFYVLLALFAWNLDLISSSPLFWQPFAPVRCDSPRLLLDEFRLFST